MTRKHGRAPIALASAIPLNFRCEMCGEPRPAVYQWAVIPRGAADYMGYKAQAICRPCLAANMDLACSPLLEELQAQLKASRRVTTSIKIVAASGILIPAPAGLCVMACGRFTRRSEGYCNPCRYQLLRKAHGGMGAYREDAHGRRFVVFGAEEWLGNEEPGVIYKEAYYAWGRERLPLNTSKPTTEEAYTEQAQWMWRGVAQFLEYSTKVARKKAGKNYDEEAHDVAVEAACKAYMTYIPHEAKASFETYLHRSVTHAVWRATAVRRQKARRTLSLDVVAREPEDLSEKKRIDRMFGNVQEAGALLDSIGLTPFERKVLTMHVVDGLTCEAIGHQYGVVRSTVHKWIHVAREKGRLAAIREGIS